MLRRRNKATMPDITAAGEQIAANVFGELDTPDQKRGATAMAAQMYGAIEGLHEKGGSPEMVAVLAVTISNTFMDLASAEGVELPERYGR